MVILELGAEPVVSSLALDLVEAFEEVLALPGEVAGGVRSTKALISTLAVDTGFTASAYVKLGCPPTECTFVAGLLSV